MDRSRARRGWLSLYVGAFALLVGAGAALLGSSLGTLRSLGLLWLSVVLSAAAVAVAIASVVLPSRR